MKKKFLLTLLSAAIMAGMTACTDDGPKGGGGDDPDPEPTPDVHSSGVFVVNSGAMYANKPGSLEYVNYDSKTVIPDVFFTKTGMYIGDTFNSGYVYEKQIFLAVTDSRVFHVMDKDNFQLVTTVQPDATAGPRYFTSFGGYVYCTLYGNPGYLCRINPATFACDLIEVGPHPEYVVPFNGKLYVAVSDGYSADFGNSCIVVVDPATFKVTKRITGIKNPVQLATNGSQLFVCSWGEYTPEYTVINQGVHQIVNDVIGENICQGNYMALDGNDMYVIDATFDAEQFYYWHVDAKTGDKKEWISAKDAVFSPTAIGVDPSKHFVIILSNVEGEYGYPSYTTDGYMNFYSQEGKLLGSCTTGVGPTGMFFDSYNPL